MISQLELQNELHDLIEFQLSERKVKEAQPFTALLDIRMEVINTPSVIDYAAYCEYQAARSYIASIKSYGAGLCSELIQEKNFEEITTDYLKDVINSIETYNTLFYRCLALMASPTDWYSSIVAFVEENLNISSMAPSRRKAFQVLKEILPSRISSSFYTLPKNIIVSSKEGQCKLQYSGTDVDPERFVFSGCYIGSARVTGIEDTVIFTEGKATGSTIFFPFFKNPPTPVSLVTFGDRETVIRSLASRGLLPYSDPSVKICLRALRIVGFTELVEDYVTIDYPKNVQSGLLKVKDSLRRNGFPYGYDKLIKNTFNLNNSPEEDSLLSIIAEVAEFADTRSTT